MLREAERALRRGNEELALESLRQAAEKNSDLAPAVILLAQLHLADGQAAKAQNLLEKAAVIYPDDPQPHLMFADRAWQERRLSDAHVQYTRARGLAANMPDDASRKKNLQIWALAGSGSVAEARNLLALAKKHYTEVLELEPQHARAHARMGHIAFAQDRPDEALAHFREAASGAPSPLAPELKLATLYINAGKLNEGRQWIEQAIEATPEDSRPLISLARFHLEFLSDPAATLETLDRLSKPDADSAETQMLRGLAVWQQGDLETAQQIFESLVLKSPDSIDANANLASILAEQGGVDQLRRAWELLQVSASANPKSPTLTAAAGWIAFHQGNWSVAQQRLQAVAATPQASRDAKYYFARVLFRQGQVAAAQQLFSQALEGRGLFVHARDAKQLQNNINAGKAQR